MTLEKKIKLIRVIADNKFTLAQGFAHSKDVVNYEKYINDYMNLNTVLGILENDEHAAKLAEVYEL